MATTFSYPTSVYRVRCCSMREDHDQHKQQMNSGIRVNGSYKSPIKIDSLGLNAESSTTTLDPVVSIVEIGHRQNIPIKKQLVDPNHQGLIVEGGVGYKQTVVIRSYKVGLDKIATLKTILNLLQETALNHVWMSGLLSDGFGATHGIIRNNLIWVMSRMQVLINYYPIW